MQREFKELSVTDVEYATRRCRDYLASAEDAVFDVKRNDRRAASKCAFCFYRRGSRIGGAAITMQPCGICGVNQTFSSTATDKLCKACAAKNHLCVECGADIDGKRRRKVQVGGE